jgi:hypothetical protein
MARVKRKKRINDESNRSVWRKQRQLAVAHLA